MSKSKSDQFEKLYARNRQEWREWLEENHTTSPGIWLIYYKKGTDEPCVSYDGAVEEALSFGWIDSKVNAIDDKRYMQIFTPRKPKSIWSKINRQRVKKLIRNGSMTPAGLDKIETAKKDGSWDFLDDIENLVIPQDLKKSLNVNPNAKANFEAFNDSVKKQILYWIKTAKRPETRIKRINKTIILSEQNRWP